MAIGVKLAKLIQDVRNEVGSSSFTSRGIDHDEHIAQLIRRHHRTLVEERDWEHLNLTRDNSEGHVAISAGVNLYTIPAVVNPQKIAQAWVYWGTAWEPVEYGINYGDYTAFNPATDQRADPALQWDFRGIGQFEVWPLPASAQTFAFTGQRAVTDLASRDDAAQIDDILIVLHVAAELMLDKGKEAQANAKLAAAAKRMDIVCAGLGSQGRITMGAGRIGTERTRPRHPTFIRSR